jgi:hypothetical protein
MDITLVSAFRMDYRVYNLPMLLSLLSDDRIRMLLMAASLHEDQRRVMTGDLVICGLSSMDAWTLSFTPCRMIGRMQRIIAYH